VLTISCCKPEGRRAYSPQIVEGEDIPLLEDLNVHLFITTATDAAVTMHVRRLLVTLIARPDGPTSGAKNTDLTCLTYSDSYPLIMKKERGVTAPCVFRMDLPRLCRGKSSTVNKASDCFL
jgi:hypothetical protein